MTIRSMVTVRYNRYYTVVTYAICGIIGLAHIVIRTDIYFSGFTIDYYVFMGYMCYD